MRSFVSTERENEMGKETSFIYTREEKKEMEGLARKDGKPTERKQPDGGTSSPTDEQTPDGGTNSRRRNNSPTEEQQPIGGTEK